MATTYERNEHLAGVAARLIAKRHQALAEHAVEVRYSTRDDSPKEAGTDHDKLWQVRKVTGQAALEMRQGAGDKPLFLLSVPTWTLTKLDESTFEALVDEALCSMDAAEEEDGEVKLSRIGYDWHGYSRNIAEYGPWHERTKEALEALQGTLQLALPMDSEAPEEYAPTAEEREETQEAAATEAEKPKPSRRPRQRPAAGSIVREDFGDGAQVAN